MQCPSLIGTADADERGQASGRKPVTKTIERFCREFLEHPYLCYTEHGLHARFYSMLYDALPPEKRYGEIDRKRVCLLQKEYPTAHNLDKSRRQNWDISLIRSPLSAKPEKCPKYDYLQLDSVVEFALNEDRKHLEEDIRRLCHSESNVINKFIVYLYRIFQPRVSGRDLSPGSSRLIKPESIHKLVGGRAVDAYLVTADTGRPPLSGAWRIADNTVTKL